MSNVSRSDAGTYTCGNGRMTDIIPNCGQTLIVLGEPTKPVISLQSTPVVGRNVTMTCSSTSTTLPADHGLTFTYTWKIDGLNITSSDGASLTVPVESHGPQGITCHVTEDKGLGRDSDVLMLTPDSPLSVPENFQCQNKAGSYILQWTPGGDDETRGVGFLVEQRLPQANWTTVSATVESDGMMRQVQLP
ncbi:contactin-4-like [Haliotis rufescens]|uniref:contactin-4-like n=1 Tax=Haliotis rufescens TaxID=6454 RepID=UPI00201F001E|nr:contactin-4-like [Haliotis rufescens]